MINFGVFLRQVLYGEETIPVQADATQLRKEHMNKRAQEAHEISRAQAKQAAKETGGD